MLSRAQAEVRRTLEEVQVARSQFPVLLRQEGGWLRWLKGARSAQVCLVCTVVACVWLFPGWVEGVLALLLPEQTKSSGFLGLRKTTVSHPWVEPLTTVVMLLLWAGGLLTALRLLLRRIPVAVAGTPSVASQDATRVSGVEKAGSSELGSPVMPANPVSPAAAMDATLATDAGNGLEAIVATPSSAQPASSFPTRAGMGPASQVVLAGRYTLGDKLGAGGMGEVFLARDLVLERKVALKRLPPQLWSNQSLRERFRREARSLARLSHAHVVQVFDFIELPDGQEGSGMWMVLEVVGGGDLEACLEHGRLELPRVLELARQMGSALQAAHAEGIVHRDFKPANVMLTKEGHAKVTDFGIARMEVAAEGDSPKLTQTGAVMGTPTYMSPEQARGTPVGPESDVYSFGATLYEMLTGRPVFDGTLAQVLTAHLMTAPAPFAEHGVKDVPRELEALVLAMLAKEAGQRPSLHEVLHSLEALSRKAS